MDAFQVLQMSLGPALEAIDQGNRGRLAVAQMANQRAYEAARTESERRHQRSLIEEDRKYATAREQRLRSERKSDVAEDRLRELRLQYAALNGNPEGLTEEQLSKGIHDLGIADAIKMNLAKKEGELRGEAKIAGVPNAESADISKVAQDLAEKQVTLKIDQENKMLAARVQAARNSPDYKNAQANLAMAIHQQQQAIVAQTRELPQLHQQLTPRDKGTLGQLYASHPELREIISTLPLGKELLKNLSRGDPDAYEKLLKAGEKVQSKDKMRYQMAMASFAEQTDNLIASHAREYSGELQAYLKAMQVLPDIIKVTDKQIENYFNDPQFGLALRRENRGELLQAVEEGKFGDPSRFNMLPTSGQTSPDTAPQKKLTALPGMTSAPAQAPSISTPGAVLSPVSQSAVNPTAVIAPVAAPAETLIGPPALKDSLVQRVLELRNSYGRDYSDAVLTPFYQGAANVLGVKPQPIGGSVFLKAPRSVMQDNPLAYDPQYSALSPEQKNALILGAINASYDNPTFQRPWLDWQTKP